MYLQLKVQKKWLKASRNEKVAQVSQEAANKAAEKSAAASTKAAEKAAESTTEGVSEKAAEKASEKATEFSEKAGNLDKAKGNLQAQADVAHSGISDPNLIEATMEQTGVEEVTNMEKDASKLWFTSLTSGIVVGIDKIVMLIALIVFRIGWWATIYCQQILLGMLTIFGPIQWAFSLLVTLTSRSVFLPAIFSA